jgi:hypothetical protein
MSKRAVIRQADLNRALKAAAKLGYEVRVEGAVIRLLPASPQPAQAPADQADTDWDKALGLR